LLALVAAGTPLAWLVAALVGLVVLVLILLVLVVVILWRVSRLERRLQPPAQTRQRTPTG
jgi:Na+-transporting methylmalonyl-CoA/oxaloacetate decarboxylase gamma subunit